MTLNEYVSKKLSSFYIFLIVVVMAVIAAGVAVNIADVARNPEFYTSAPGGSYETGADAPGFWPVIFIMITPVIALAGALVLEFRSDRSTSWFIAGITVYLVFNYFLAASDLFR